MAFGVWPTSWGAMGGARTENGLARVVLPHYAPAELRELLAFECPGARCDEKDFEELMARCQAYFNGQAAGFDDFSDRPDAPPALRLDLPGERTFAGRVLRACRAVPYGQTRSYSWLAEAAGKPDGARAAAAAIGRNPLPLVLPCHRITYAGGEPGGFSAPGGVELKRRMLQLEKAR